MGRQAKEEGRRRKEGRTGRTGKDRRRTGEQAGRRARNREHARVHYGVPGLAAALHAYARTWHYCNRLCARMRWRTLACSLPRNARLPRLPAAHRVARTRTAPPHADIASHYAHLRLLLLTVGGENMNAAFYLLVLACCLPYLPSPPFYARCVNENARAARRANTLRCATWFLLQLRHRIRPALLVRAMVRLSGARAVYGFMRMPRAAACCRCVRFVPRFSALYSPIAHAMHHLQRLRAYHCAHQANYLPCAALPTRIFATSRYHPARIYCGRDRYWFPYLNGGYHRFGIYSSLVHLPVLYSLSPGSVPPLPAFACHTHTCPTLPCLFAFPLTSRTHTHTHARARFTTPHTHTPLPRLLPAAIYCTHTYLPFTTPTFTYAHACTHTTFTTTHTTHYTMPLPPPYHHTYRYTPSCA